MKSGACLELFWPLVDKSSFDNDGLDGILLKELNIIDTHSVIIGAAFSFEG